MAWTVNLSNSQLNNLVSGALADGSYTYQEMLDLLSTVAAGGVTVSELSNTAAAKPILNNTSRVSPWISWRWCYWPMCQKAEHQTCSAG